MGHCRTSLTTKNLKESTDCKPEESILSVDNNVFEKIYTKYTVAIPNCVMTRTFMQEMFYTHQETSKLKESMLNSAELLRATLVVYGFWTILYSNICQTRANNTILIDYLNIKLFAGIYRAKNF